MWSCCRCADATANRPYAVSRRPRRGGRPRTARPQARPPLVAGVLLPLVVIPLLGGCALTAQSEPERVVLPTGGVGSPAVAERAGVPLSLQVYLVHGDRLQRVTRLASPGKGLEPVLRALSAPVDAAELAAGLRTALPAASRPLTGRLSDAQTADVTVPPGYDHLSLGEQEMAAAQVVFTVMADTLADRIRLVDGGRVVAVPVTGGDLVTRALTRQDYATLAPPR